MPVVLGDNERGEPPSKRRKLLLPESDMAKRHKNGLLEDQWNVEKSGSQQLDENAGQNHTIEPQRCIRTSSREELIECIKRGEKPTWVPTPGFQALCEEEEARNASRRLRSQQQPMVQEASEVDQMLLDSDGSDHIQQNLSPSSQPQQEPYERPRSALHRGDFSDVDTNTAVDFWTNPDYQPGLAISTLDRVTDSQPHWYTDSPRPKSFAAMPQARTLSQLNTSITLRRRAPSLGSSLSSSFVMRAPTSPLVYATSNPSLDTSTNDLESEQPRLRHDSRRRTMPPNSFHAFSMTPIDATPPNFSRPFAPALRREASMPTHTHRPQRSLSSFTYHPKSNPQTPLMRSRRPSFTSESGSRRRTSMVGSFEESILRGRMSTPPSKPLDFVAQIGVMGKGDCSSSLKCPAHVSVSFPAVFYSYPASTGVRSVADDTPSPYVGTIDLDRNLKAVVLASKKSKKDMLVRNREDVCVDDVADPAFPEMELDTKLHVGGAYRIPRQGQLQIVIKNPNKTAVKLFLIPYDLADMEVGTKTFVRQRSYSTGSIIENALGGERPQSQFVDPLENKNILRYLVHLKFCCPAKNRFYLYDDIRVVFANRVPDGKEKLRNELQLPDPKYSPWKSSKPETLQKASKSAPTTPVTKTFEFGSPQFFGEMDGFHTVDSPASPTPNRHAQHDVPPFEFPRLRSRPASPVWNMRKASPDIENSSFGFPDIKSSVDVTAKPERALSPITGFEPTTPLPGSSVPWRTPSGGNHSNRSFSPTPEARDSLLSKQLKQLHGQWSKSKETISQQPEKDDELGCTRRQV